MKHSGQSLDFIKLCNEYNLDFEFPEIIYDAGSSPWGFKKVYIWNKNNKDESIEDWTFSIRESSESCIWGMLIDQVISRKYDRSYKGKLFNG